MKLAQETTDASGALARALIGYPPGGKVTDENLIARSEADGIVLMVCFLEGSGKRNERQTLVSSKW